MTDEDVYTGTLSAGLGVAVSERGRFSNHAATWTLMPWLPNPRSRPPHRRYYAVHAGPCEVASSLFWGIDYAAWRTGLELRSDSL